MKRLVARLIRRRAKVAEADPIRLGRRRIYILPTRAGVLFAVVVAVMLLGAINYNNSLGMGFTFLLISMAVVTMLHTHRNLSGLLIRSGQASPVFAGSMARFEILLSARKAPARTAIAVRVNDQPPILHAVSAAHDSQTVAALNIPAAQRGVLRLGRCEVSTTYPLGLFRAWGWVHPDLTCLVYPRPETGAVPAIPLQQADASTSHKGLSGREDFRGLHAYRPGDSPRHLTWKPGAFGPHPFTKQFEGDAGGQAWLDWDQLQNLQPEERLSRLCRWVLDSHREGHRYGLRVPGTTIELGSGEQHKRRCLEALALLKLPGLTGGGAL